MGHPGVCLDYLAKEPYINCGLATKLVGKCMNSAMIQENGGVDVKEDLMSTGQSVNGMEEYFDQIKEHCETVVALPCIPNFAHLSVSEERCIPYFDIADGAGYVLMFLRIVHLSHFS